MPVRAIAARRERLDRRDVMDQQAAPKFDTGAYEEALIEAGVDPKVAKAHRAQLALVINSATKEVVNPKDLAMSESRLEAKIDKAVTELTWRMLGGMAALVAIMVAIVKLA